MKPGDIGIVNDEYVTGDVIMYGGPSALSLTNDGPWTRVGRICFIIAAMRGYVCILDDHGNLGWIAELMISEHQ